ncbi:FbpB family small basic protein [Jeotgalibacillus soli]|uniref:FbpB family small basic protein n=1 Tax=Jeotgalibacillus soli TaxID=889306 RepID=A0A0C2VL10_9BACL|nr:FbpB family small basic protein [Jeotgalibacillus soli]KIL45136.1 hypothetical protein KP78_26800 [Jeotgalibacillus soli]
MGKKYAKSFQELVNENKKEILNNKEALEKIEERIEKRYDNKKLA